MNKCPACGETQKIAQFITCKQCLKCHTRFDDTEIKVITKI